MMRAILLSLLLLLPLPAVSGPGVVRIGLDLGGLIQARAERIREIHASGASVVIDGECLSACTMFLGFALEDRLCVTPRARFMFHAVTPLWPPGDRAGDRMTRAMIGFYPPPLRAWFLDRVGLRNTSGGVWLEAAELVAIAGGAVPFCPGSGGDPPP